MVKLWRGKQFFFFQIKCRMSFYANFHCCCHIRASLYSAFDFNIIYAMNTKWNKIDNKMIAFKFENFYLLRPRYEFEWANVFSPNIRCTYEKSNWFAEPTNLICTIFGSTIILSVDCRNKYFLSTMNGNRKK